VYKAIPSIVFICGVLLAAVARALRCGSRIVQEGMTEVQVVELCGKPYSERQLGFVLRPYIVRRPAEVTVATSKNWPSLKCCSILGPANSCAESASRVGASQTLKLPDTGIATNSSSPDSTESQNSRPRGSIMRRNSLPNQGKEIFVNE